MPSATREPLFGAIRANYVALIRIVQAEVLVQPDDLKLNAVLYAVSMGNVEVLRALHEKGVDLAAHCDAEGFGTAAFYAVQFNKQRVLELLIELGYDILTQPCDKFRRPALYHAVRTGREQIVELLLQAKLTNRAARLLQRFMRRSVLQLKEARVQRAVRVIQRFWRRQLQLLREHYAREQEEAERRAREEAQRRKAVVDEFEEWGDDDDLYGV